MNIRIPEEGEKIKRLIEIAKERNIDYKPSAESMIALNDYCDRKGIPHPLNDHKNQHVQNMAIPPPIYNPLPPPPFHQPPPPGHFPPPGGHFVPPPQPFVPPPGGVSLPPYQQPMPGPAHG